MLTPRAAQDQTHAHVAFAISAGTSTLQLRKGAGVIAQDSKAREELGKTKDCGEDCKLKPGKTEEQQFGSSLRLRWQGAGPRLYLFSVVRKLNRYEPSLMCLLLEGSGMPEGGPALKEEPVCSSLDAER